MSAAVGGDDVEAAVAANAAFHARVMGLAGNAVLAELAGQVDRRVRWYYTPVARQRGEQSWIEHRELIAAIAARRRAAGHGGHAGRTRSTRGARTTSASAADGCAPGRSRPGPGRGRFASLSTAPACPTRAS